MYEKSRSTFLITSASSTIKTNILLLQMPSQVLSRFNLVVESIFELRETPRAVVCHKLHLIASKCFRFLCFDVRSPLGAYFREVCMDFSLVKCLLKVVQYMKFIWEVGIILEINRA